ncbi:hypothetical protein GGR54DRAFT_63598 [Hypoxylon sp. NC1633]|nr:hypothetical protein GGR54DRAFT_63598 [Hypoxylon sp. NC1633]
MTTQPPTPTLRLLQATAITVLTSSAGLSASLSLFTIPRLLTSPTPVLIRQFNAMLAAAHAYLPLPLVLPSLAHLYLAWALPGKTRLYVVAAVLSLTTLPWTSVAMLPLNRAMARKLEVLDAADVGVGDVLVDEMAGSSARGGQDETAHALADSWATRNLYRPAVALAAGCIGLYAALS